MIRLSAHLSSKTTSCYAIKQAMGNSVAAENYTMRTHHSQYCANIHCEAYNV